jgi:hypothetical protein
MAARTGGSNTNPQRINPNKKRKKTQNFPADEHSAKPLFAPDLSTPSSSPGSYYSSTPYPQLLYGDGRRRQGKGERPSRSPQHQQAAAAKPRRSGGGAVVVVGLELERGASALLLRH